MRLVEQRTSVSAGGGMNGVNVRHAGGGGGGGGSTRSGVQGGSNVRALVSAAGPRKLL